MTNAERGRLDRLLDGDLPPAEWGAAQELLETEVEAVAYLAERAALVSNLRRSLKRRRLQNNALTVIGNSCRDGSDGPAIGRTCWRRASLFWAAAIFLVLLVALGALLHRGPAQPQVAVADRGDGGPVVEVVASQDAVPPQDWKAGTRAPMRRLTLASGRVALRLPGGVSLDLAGPLEADLASASELRLSRGKVAANVDDGETRFVVQTAQARVVDRGSSFGVAVGGSNETDVAAFDGAVEIVYPAQDAESPKPILTLNEGEAVRVDASRKPRRLKMIALGADARSFRDHAASEIVEDVRDNVTAANFHRYYGLLSGGMNEGARLYTTGHNRTWHALPGQPFPRDLLGADVICTFSADRRAENLEITLVLNQPCELYVLCDARSPAPAWLREGFVETGLIVRSGPWTPRATLPATSAGVSDEAAYVPHAVWRKVVAKPGPVVLGPPRSPGTSGPQAMYGIAVKGLH